MAKLLGAIRGWRGTGQCDGCPNKLYFPRRSKCFSCKNFFCDVCIQKRPDKKMCCKKCLILTATPLDKNDLLNLRSRDLVNYLASKHISTSGCVEKEDLVNALMRAVNNSSSSSTFSHSQSNNGYSNSPGKTSISNTNSDSGREAHPSRESCFNEDGIRIVGSDIVDNEGSCSSSNNSYDIETMGEADCAMSNADTMDNAEPEKEPPPCVNDGAHGQTSTEQEVQSSVFSQDNETSVRTEKINRPLKLSDISCSEDLDKLSVKELKMLLMMNRTDFKGCVERAELIEKASRLWSDYTLSRKDLEKLSLEELCKICMDAPIECVLLECGHMATCMNCGKQLFECPVCRQYVVRCVRTFKV